jgi:hypothetical protein
MIERDLGHVSSNRSQNYLGAEFTAVWEIRSLRTYTPKHY